MTTFKSLNDDLTEEYIKPEDSLLMFSEGFSKNFQENNDGFEEKEFEKGINERNLSNENALKDLLCGLAPNDFIIPEEETPVEENPTVENKEETPAEDNPSVENKEEIENLSTRKE